MKTDPYFSVWEALLLQQRKARFIGLSLAQQRPQIAPGLSHVEGLILLIIELEPGRNIGKLASALGLERSWVSRIVLSLSERGLVSTDSADDDKRNRIVQITKKGRSERAGLMSFREEVLKIVFGALSHSELSELIRLLGSLADGLKAPDYGSLENADPLDIQLARISRMIGIVGENYMQSGMNVTKYQLFFELARQNGGVSSASELALIFPADASTVSRTVSALCEEGIAERKTSATDARKQLLHMTRKGEALWKEMQKKASAVMREALSGLSQAEIDRLTGLLGKVVGEMPGRIRPQTSPRTEIRAINREERTELANRYSQFRSSFEAERDLYGLFDKGDLRGLVETEISSAGDFPRISVHVDNASERDLVHLVRNALKLARSARPRK